jgi:hypothetical protein
MYCRPDIERAVTQHERKSTNRILQQSEIQSAKADICTPPPPTIPRAGSSCNRNGRADSNTEPFVQQYQFQRPADWCGERGGLAQGQPLAALGFISLYSSQCPAEQGTPRVRPSTSQRRHRYTGLFASCQPYIARPLHCIQPTFCMQFLIRFMLVPILAEILLKSVPWSACPSFRLYAGRTRGRIYEF